MGRWRQARYGRDLRWRCEERQGGCKAGWRMCLFPRRDTPGTPTGHSSPCAAAREIEIYAPRKESTGCALRGGLWPPLETQLEARERGGGILTTLRRTSTASFLNKSLFFFSFYFLSFLFFQVFVSFFFLNNSYFLFKFWVKRVFSGNGEFSS